VWKCDREELATHDAPMDDVDDEAWPNWAAKLSAILKLRFRSDYSRRECRRDPRDGKARDMMVV
jgi:hypothetical protein